MCSHTVGLSHFFCASCFKNKARKVYDRVPIWAHCHVGPGSSQESGEGKGQRVGVESGEGKEQRVGVSAMFMFLSAPQRELLMIATNSFVEYVIYVRLSSKLRSVFEVVFDLFNVLCEM